MLDRILHTTRARVAELIPREQELAERAAGVPDARDVAGALLAPGLSVIAEIKRRSPSAGPLALDLDPGAQAAAYVAGGAAAVSVLTEPHFFGGTLDDLAAVRAAVDAPVLRKDFVVHPVQIWEARAAGADVILLIVAALAQTDLETLLETSRVAGIAALVEAHTAQEAERAVAAGAHIVGVNNRDLTTFVTDLSVAEKIAALLPDEAIRVAESGVSSPEGAARMRAAGYDAILVGEALVRSADPAALVRRLKG